MKKHKIISGYVFTLLMKNELEKLAKLLPAELGMLLMSRRHKADILLDIKLSNQLKKQTNDEET
jgi:hypothetical protein